MKSRTNFIWLFMAFIFFQLNAQNPSEKFNKIVEEYQSFQKNEFDSPDQYFASVKPEDQLRRSIFYQNIIENISNINKSALNVQEHISAELLAFILEDKIDREKFKDYLVPFNAEGGWYTDFILSVNRQKIKNKKDAEHYIEKLKAFKNHAQDNMQLMREGLKTGIRAPYAILKGRENIIDEYIVDDPGESIFYKPFLELPENITAQDQAIIKSDAEQAIKENVLPAYKEFSQFWKNKYLPKSRKEIGVIHQPKGKEYYEQRVRFFTTLKMSPKEVYDIGQKEVARIKKEMETIIEEVGFEGSFADFLAFLRTDEQFYAKTPEELLKEASFISKKIDGLLPKYFGKLPRNSYGVQPVPAAIAPTYTGGRYSPGSLENGRAGNYWVNTYNLPARPLYVLPSLTLHEAVPGHHLQISLAQEMDGMPEFRRETYLSAYGEGWALYGEWLGAEMGIYTTPYERFGKLTYEMWRACRLVVDPGMHVFGMSRQEAIDFMSSNTALSLHECTTEIDRYIGWPGQAVSYKIGELKIRELRKMAEKKLGDKFDIREFHDLILSNGAVPLFILERMVRDWLENF